MLSERLQILVSTQQRRRLEAEAKRRGTSVGSLIRQAIDKEFGTVSREDRLEALESVRGIRGRFLSPRELNELVETERDRAAISPPRH